MVLGCYPSFPSHPGLSGRRTPRTDCWPGSLGCGDEPPARAAGTGRRAGVRADRRRGHAAAGWRGRGRAVVGGGSPRRSRGGGPGGHAHGDRRLIARHEAGHVAAARAVGGRVVSAEASDREGLVRAVVPNVQASVTFLRAGGTRPVLVAAAPGTSARNAPSCATCPAPSVGSWCPTPTPTPTPPNRPPTPRSDPSRRPHA